jgi:hypothetical protein
MELVAAWGADRNERSEGWSRYHVLAIAVCALSAGLMALPPTVAVLILLGWIG